MEEITLYILGAGASKPDGLPLTSEVIDKAFWNFGGKYDNRDEYMLGTWEKEDVFKIIRPVFELMDHFYNTNLVRLLERYYKEGHHPSSLDVSTNSLFIAIKYLLSGNHSINNINQLRTLIFIQMILIYSNLICSIPILLAPGLNQGLI